MFDLKEGEPIQMLRQFAAFVDGEMYENYGAAKLTVKNEKANGYISLYEPFPGLTSWIYNIEFSTELEFSFIFSNDRPVYFGYILSGFQLQKFPEEEESTVIEENQNFILITEPDSSCKFVISGKELFQCCYIIINTEVARRSSTVGSSQVQVFMGEMFEQIDKNQRYRYQGSVGEKSRLYAETIISNERTDLVGRLLTEGAIMSLLGTQIRAHDQDPQTKKLLTELTREDLKKLATIGDYVETYGQGKITLTKVATKLKLSPRKINAGVQFLFGVTFVQYITNLRLESAKDYMQCSNDSLKEICFRFGFMSRTRFNELFLNKYGILPADYMEELANDTTLFEICYRSLARKNIVEKDVVEIMALTERNNVKKEMTGCLLFYQNVFFQLIEGPRKEVLCLYNKIKNDKRHRDIDIIWKGAKPKRNFTSWVVPKVKNEKVLYFVAPNASKEINMQELVDDELDNSLTSRELWLKIRKILHSGEKRDK